MYILSVHSMNVSRIAGNMLPLQFMSGSSYPGSTLLDLKIVWNSFSGIHYLDYQNKYYQELQVLQFQTQTLQILITPIDVRKIKQMTKAKILCLHGYGTNAHFMQKQATSFLKLVSRQAQLIFVDGPFLAPQNFVVDQKVINMIEGQHRSWFPHIRMEYLKDQYLNELDKVRIAFQKGSDHYDGIMGFSQGAGAIHFLMKLKDSGMIKWKILDGIKFSINLNGNHIKSSFFENNDKQLDLPSLHFVSPQDFIFSKSILHTTQYKNPIVLSHSYGHKFPKLGLIESKLVVSFVRKHSGTAEKKKEEYEVLSLSSL